LQINTLIDQKDTAIRNPKTTNEILTPPKFGNKKGITIEAIEICPSPTNISEIILIC
jgi:hypothetical protein